LSILTGGEFTPDEPLSNAHALLVLAPDDPRRERLYLAVLRGQEAQENGDRRAVIARSCSDKGMKIALGIEEEDIERIVRSLDNHHAYTRSGTLRTAGTSGWQICFADS
jgi:hypothetical protein